MAIQLTSRDKLGSTAAKAARREGKTPVTVYGRGRDSISALIDTQEMELVLREHGRNAVFEVNVEDTTERVMIAEIERHAIRGELVNLQFRVLEAGQKVEVTVPIEVLDTERITEAVVNQNLLELVINVDPSNIPSSFQISVDGMEIGDSKLVSDLEIPEGVELVTEMDETVVSVTAPRVEEEPEETEEIDPAAVETTEQANEEDTEEA